MGEFVLGAVTSWSCHWLPGHFTVTTKLQEVTAIKETRYNVLMKELGRCFK